MEELFFISVDVPLLQIASIIKMQLLGTVAGRWIHRK